MVIRKRQNKAVQTMAAGFIVFGVFISLCFSENALPPMLQGVRFDQKLNNQIPLDATFRDESGKEVRLKDLRWRVAEFRIAGGGCRIRAPGFEM